MNNSHIPPDRPGCFFTTNSVFTTSGKKHVQMQLPYIPQAGSQMQNMG